MRIAISDYDGTLKQNGRVSDEDLAAIAAWRDQGNPFGIATGRDLGMTLHETDKFGVPFDFLICMNGCALYDADRSLIQATEMQPAVVAELVRDPAAADSFHMALMAGHELAICFHGEDSWFFRGELAHRCISEAEAAAMTGVIQISLGYPTVEQTLEWGEELRRRYAGRIAVHPNGRSVDINAFGTDKAEGIAAMAALKGWDTADILVIGDGGNDLGMITAFNGYTLHHGLEELKTIARGVVANLAEALAS